MLLSNRDDFLRVYADVVGEVIEVLSVQYELPVDAVSYIREMFDYNVPTGKLYRGMSVVNAYAVMMGRILSEEELRQISLLGWAVEWLEAFLLVEDDIMDNSSMRRGKPCWYKVKNVGLSAINDGCILKSTLKIIVRRYFREKSYYVNLLELFDEVMLQTELGQFMDLSAQPEEGVVDINRFTFERYKHIAKYKTAYYSFYLPVALAMIMSDISEEKAFDEAKNILTEMGIFFQAQDDFLDCFGDSETIGKVGTDIQDNKCSWLIVHAISLATPEQLITIKENYGKNDAISIEKVKAVYRDLNLEATFKRYEDATYNKLLTMIASVSHVPQEVYVVLLEKIFRRVK